MFLCFVGSHMGSHVGSEFLASLYDWLCSSCSLCYLGGLWVSGWFMGFVGSH